MPRARDYAYEALAQETATDMNVGRGQLNAALRDIKLQCDSPDLAAEIHARAVGYRRMWPEMALTPNALAKHWARIVAEKPAPRTNQTVRSDCSRCSGDGLILIREDPDLFDRCPECQT